MRLLKYCGIYRPDIKNISLPEIVTIIIQCIADVCEYLNITPDEFLRRNQQWPSLEEFLWNESDGDLSLFYRSWNGKYAEYNICCNSYNQLLYPENFGVLAHIGGIVVRGGGGGYLC
ncbi:MAG: hypothetical protein LBQ74_02770 [Prevotella sp.]|nr:hypothetical protein [Prevotella sp.]